LIASGGLAAAATVTTPYFNDFSGSASDFVTSGNWAVGSGVFTNTVATGGANGTATSASVSAPSLAGQSFTMSSNFTFGTTGNTGTSTVGFGALGTTADFSAAGSATNIYMLADISSIGGLRFVRIAAANTTYGSAKTWSGGTLVNGVNYTMTLSGTYLSNGSMTLTLSLSNGTITDSISETIAAANIPLGNNFGLRDRANPAAGLNVAFDNFSLAAIPEPSSALLVVAGALGVMARRRR
jgi:hypothetical protein